MISKNMKKLYEDVRKMNGKVKFNFIDGMKLNDIKIHTLYA